jgi:hypothetical protein
MAFYLPRSFRFIAAILPRNCREVKRLPMVTVTIGVSRKEYRPGVWSGRFFSASPLKQCLVLMRSLECLFFSLLAKQRFVMIPQNILNIL